jgi:hypothetical protein
MSGTWRFGRSVLALVVSAALAVALTGSGHAQYKGPTGS